MRFENLTVTPIAEREDTPDIPGLRDNWHQMGQVHHTRHSANRYLGNRAHQLRDITKGAQRNTRPAARTLGWSALARLC
jgi:hypothetical protein